MNKYWNDWLRESASEFDIVLFEWCYTFGFGLYKFYSKVHPEKEQLYLHHNKQKITEWLYKRVKDKHSIEECKEVTDIVWKEMEKKYETKV